jgi:hypothetical protein
LETVYGTYDKKYGCVLCGGGCDPGGCQIGLTLAHLSIWETILTRNLSAAWVFENDVVFHARFSELLPLYWAGVPQDYEIVYVGQHPMGGVNLACETKSSVLLQQWHAPWTTHAVIVSGKGAKRLSTALKAIIQNSQDSNRSLTFQEVKIDFFLYCVNQRFMIEKERKAWVVFDPTTAHPAEWGSHTWCRTEQHQVFYNGSATCEETDPKLWPTQVPLLGTGLAYQNLCKKNRSALDRWRHAG